MWPSDISPSLRDHPVRRRALEVVRRLFDDDSLDFDFDMLICKAPHTGVPTPAHQDQVRTWYGRGESCVYVWPHASTAGCVDACWHGSGAWVCRDVFGSGGRVWEV